MTPFETDSVTYLTKDASQIEIRQETEADWPFVYDVVQTAFASAEHKDGNEQDVVNTLRKSAAFVPELSLVATIQDEIVGHILFTKANIGGHTALALAPLSVVPDHQQQGIGQALMAEGHRRAKELGYEYSVVLGDAHYYPKAGYRPASEYGIKAPFDVPDDNFMALKLNAKAGPIAGTIEYDPAFGV